MIASGPMPRSPVWLRKIPSTVSGSQGSRRGFPPAVRFAFPLGARLNITLRARPCQELFSESFFTAVPRAAGRPALRASALRGGEFGIIRAPGAPGAGNPPAHRMPTTPARRSGRMAGDFGWEGGIGLALRTAPHARPSRIAPVQIHRRNRPGGPALARLGPPGHSIRPHTFNHLYISRRIGLTSRPKVLPPSSRKRSFSYHWRFLIRLRQTSREANTSRGCFQQPRAHRRVPSCSRP